MKNIKQMLSQPLQIPPDAQMRSSSKEIKGLYMNEEGFFTHGCPKKYQDAEMNLLDKQSDVLKEFGKKWADNPTSLYLWGNKGAGKTRYAFALIREVFRRCPKVIWPRYYTSPELDSKLHQAIMDGGDRYLIDNLCREDLLFIDDFGRETKSDRMRRQYFEIINYRYSNELPTVFTSNFDLEFIAEHLGDVIASRIEESKIVKFTGKDLRKHEMVV